MPVSLTTQEVRNPGIQIYDIYSGERVNGESLRRFS